MRVISMAYVWPAFVAEEKLVTRRDWQSNYAKHFKAGDELQVWSKSPRFKYNKHHKEKPMFLGVLRLKGYPYVEDTGKMPNDDYEGEGFEYMNSLAEMGYRGPRPYDKADSFTFGNFDLWRLENVPLWVIRFDILRVEQRAKDRLNALVEELEEESKVPLFDERKSI